MIDFWVGNKIYLGRDIRRESQKTVAIFYTLDPVCHSSADVSAVKTTQTFGVWEKRHFSRSAREADPKMTPERDS